VMTIVLSSSLSAGVGATITISGFKTPNANICNSASVMAAAYSSTVSAANLIGLSSTGMIPKVGTPTGCPV
jgi:hypothetical protein